MRLHEALTILMRAAQRDVTGAGMGYRDTTDEWRKTVASAWVVAFKKLNYRRPTWNEAYNGGMAFYLSPDELLDGKPVERKE